MRIFEALFLRVFYMTLWLKQRTTLGAQIVLIDNRKILLVRHTYKSGWHLPGGGVEPPEPPEATAMRELREGVGYELLDHPELVGIFPNVSSATKSDYLAIFASTGFRAAAGERRHALAEVRWFAVDDLPHDVVPICRTVVRVLID
ncbi:NUDIX domain-containing protein [Rhizobiaceae bacterium BDR2-2]|uniref:NUDIX domain-containing protein n=1 Tax=Ectorhizobium quercum TaxID=2965071 RepID=A0AAE3N3N2_9HYPH|nr:NUDIX domain-containing protein [Ectorhizobium quercum]MCX8997907.1 NUDIX domain-containing protein [Ectorhizobium quercum]